ncbi:hypothetical protein FKM82_015859 [Ascaphus truei]
MASWKTRTAANPGTDRAEYLEYNPPPHLQEQPSGYLTGHYCIGFLVTDVSAILHEGRELLCTHAQPCFHSNRGCARQPAVGQPINALYR